MNVDNETVNEIYEIAQEIKDVETDFYRVIESSHHYERYEDLEFPQYRVHVKIEPKEFKEYQSSYCYPIANIGREHGLFLFDTVTDWEGKTILLRFGYES